MVAALNMYKVLTVTAKLGFVATKDPEFDQRIFRGNGGKFGNRSVSTKNFKLIFIKTAYKISAQSSFHQCT